MHQALLILTNVPDEATATAIASMLVEKRLSACVNILPGVRAVYRWEGQIEQADEITLLAKTTSDRYAEAEAAIKALHPYDLPEIIAFPVAAGFPPYLKWIAQETSKDVNV